MGRDPTPEEIRKIAKRAIRAFSDLGYACCLFGSTACMMYGVERCPNDVDIIVFGHNLDPEHLKIELANEDDDFYLAFARSRNANYKVVWFDLSSAADEPRRKCKVDILVPGILEIPNTPIKRIKHQRGMLVLPILPLLLMKLKGWSDHIQAKRPDLRAKRHVDVEDIAELLRIACRRGTRIRSRSLRWLPLDFLEAAQERVLKYTRKFPETSEQWMQLGFET
ncbi:uncharacterized protein FIBRA_09157 [Fibroporia radiculosa]|uniref:Uncharacterized protein n=1 Tax=Fibroporia radiculosa TaxID=599839 RepID=J4I3X2_9APHY|nr:uncharacterized protein FIBRA_09157 [Fibroporia radiculosa]CCM06852.1 predicted protein [Fibroporia radiculosa]